MDKERAKRRHNEAQARYDKAHCTGVYLKLNDYTDMDILAWLGSQPNKQGAIKALIRKQIETERWEGMV